MSQTGASGQENATPALRQASFAAAVLDFQRGVSGPSEFLEDCLRAIAKHEERIGAFEYIDVEKAREAAREASLRWKSGRQLSNIDGMPIGIKDIIETVDMPTGMGSPLFAGTRTGRDAASVKALREAGAIILGKTVTTEFAATYPGKTRNPWDTNRTPGGSSSGSAAGVAAGFFPAGLGTQVVGSIIRPASYCGVVGFKPSYGAVNRGGSFDHMSQSSQGVLAATMQDAWRVLTNIVRRAGGDPGHPGLSGPDDLPAARMPAKLAFLKTAGWNEVAQPLRDLFQNRLDRLATLGIDVVGCDSHGVDAVENTLSSALSVTRIIVTWESRWPLNIYRDADEAKLSAGMRQRLADAEQMTIDDYRRGILERERGRAIYAALLDEGVDACITLSANGPAPIGLASTGDPGFATPCAYLGVPALSLPLLTFEGLPVGIQLMGFRDRDADLCAIAASIQQHLG